MEDATIILYIVGAIISLVLFYFIIRGASGASTRAKQLSLQNRILLHIALKQGVDINIVKELEQINQQLTEEPQIENSE